MRFFAVAASLALSAAGLSFCAGTASAAMDPFANLKFRSIGPAAPGGRVTAVAGVAGDPKTYYLGGARGVEQKTEHGCDHQT